MAEKKAKRAAKRPPRSDDMRGAGYGNNVRTTVHAPSYGQGDPLFNFNDRRGRNGMGKRVA
jgi:hypothetical protein